MEVSWPKSSSVNDVVLTDTYLNTDYILNHPLVDHITTSLS